MAVVTGSRTPEEIAALAEEISACRVCAFSEQPLPHTPNPVAVISATARVCICGQAPGTRVHASGRPFTDPSGNRLRQLMGIGEDIFYDPARLAIVIAIRGASTTHVRASTNSASAWARGHRRRPNKSAAPWRFRLATSCIPASRRASPRSWSEMAASSTDISRNWGATRSIKLSPRAS